MEEFKDCKDYSIADKWDIIRVEYYEVKRSYR